MHQFQDASVFNLLSHSVQQTLMMNPIEESGQVDIDRPDVSVFQVPLCLSNGGRRTPVGTKAVAAVMKRWFEQRLQDLE